MNENISTILRIIDHTKANDAGKVIEYAKRLVSESEWDTLDKCVRESLNPDGVNVVINDLNATTNKMLTKLNEHLGSATQEVQDAIYESITNEKFWNRWTERMHNLPDDIRLKLIKKVKSKYESKKYIHSEEKKGHYIIRYPLYELIWKYAEKYGESVFSPHIPDETDYILDGTINEMEYFIEDCKYVIVKSIREMDVEYCLYTTKEYRNL